MRYSATAPIKIIVIGAGGTGGYVIPNLYRLCFARKGYTRIIICDGDAVEEKNLIRQNFIEQDIGQNKAKVLAERYSAAFGIKCEYIPEFIESEEKMLELTSPDFHKNTWQNIPETQRVLLLGCVDNNKSRQLCHNVFKKQKDLIYIDSGNDEHVCQYLTDCRLKKQHLYLKRMLLVISTCLLKVDIKKEKPCFFLLAPAVLQV